VEWVPHPLEIVKNKVYPVVAREHIRENLKAASHQVLSDLNEVVDGINPLWI
jgi:DNA-directed RNA polymerase subunit L